VTVCLTVRLYNDDVDAIRSSKASLASFARYALDHHADLDYLNYAESSGPSEKVARSLSLGPKRQYYVDLINTLSETHFIPKDRLIRAILRAAVIKYLHKRETNHDKSSSD
jgi:hypothetical protein